jgi:DNA-binding transcriptional LysR family regulator
MTTISLDLVPPFLAVAELGSFSAAAARLGVEKSSVSRAVARLEDAVGQPLFVRTTRRVSLTDVGIAARDRLREPHAGLEAALKTVADIASTPRGRIVLTAPIDFGSVVLTEAIGRFVRQHPQVEVDLRLSSRFFDLVSDGVDAAIRISPLRLRDSAVKARKIGEVAVGIFAAPSYVEARGIPGSLEEARSRTWIVFPPLREVRMRGPDGVTALRIEGRVVCNELLFVRQAVMHGIGLGLLPRFLVDEDVRRGLLVPVLPRWMIDGVPIWFLTLPGKPPRAVEALREILVEVMASRNLGASR